MSERQIEMTWRCTSCKARNLGRFKVCQSCNNPKDGSEEYEMPEDTSKAATVTEESLLRMATAGPNWRCAYCGSDQRRTDLGCANCGASALEGAEVPDDAPAAPAAPSARVRTGHVAAPILAAEDTATPGSTRAMHALIGLGVVTIVAALGIGRFVHWNNNRPRDIETVVSDVRWERSIAVERYQIRNAEGFKEAVPKDAFEVKSLGKREHHQEQVLDHYETEHYTVEVSDGYRSESYTERVSCGEDCTERSQSCHESCSSNKNGFATCRTVCSGGGQTCRTRYCSESRTRQVPKTRTEARTRQVPQYRSEPRYAEAFSYKHWEWLPARTLNAKGSDVTVRWPEAEVGKGLGAGEQEREQRTESFAVTLSYGEHTLQLAPHGEEEFAKYAPGTKHQLHTENGLYKLDGELVTPSQ